MFIMLYKNLQLIYSSHKNLKKNVKGFKIDLNILHAHYIPNLQTKKN